MNKEKQNKFHFATLDSQKLWRLIPVNLVYLRNMLPI